MTIGERAAVVILLAGAGSFAAAACTRAAGPSVPFAVATVHTLALGTVLAGGNASFVETTFATVPKD